MFYAMLRKSNVLVATSHSFNAAKHLRRQDITFHVWGIMVLFRWSKTIQFQSRVLEIPLPRLAGSALCPAQAVHMIYQRTKGASPSGPAFVTREGDNFVPLSCKVFITQVRVAIEQLGVNSQSYAGHSFRRGGASWAYHVNIPVDTIRQLGDWKSNAYEKYIFENKESIFKATSTMVGRAAQLK